jgi:nucleolar protein 15
MAHCTSLTTQDAVVYLGHLPHGFYEDQLKSYFSQYGDVLAVKVARSKKTARSKGYAFIQFRYPEVAQIVSDTMNGYLLLGKIIVSHALPANKKNPFTYSTAGQFKFINWKRLYVKQKNEVLFFLFSLKLKNKPLTLSMVLSTMRKLEKKDFQNWVSNTNTLDSFPSSLRKVLRARKLTEKRLNDCDFMYHTVNSKTNSITRPKTM